MRIHGERPENVGQTAPTPATDRGRAARTEPAGAPATADRVQVSDQARLLSAALQAAHEAPDTSEAAIERAGHEARTLSALAMPTVCETYNRKRALKNLGKGRVVLLAAGTGNPFFTTDTTAVLRAAELEAEAVLKATNVDGVYTADPKKDPSARRYDKLSHQEALEKDLKVMDAAAFALARENRMPIIVLSIADPGAIEAVLRGKGRATVVA